MDLNDLLLSFCKKHDTTHQTLTQTPETPNSQENIRALATIKNKTKKNQPPYDDWFFNQIFLYPSSNLN
jgi:hypothetical protein